MYQWWPSLNKAGICLYWWFCFAYGVFQVLKCVLKTFLMEEVFFSGKLMNKSRHGVTELEASLGGYLFSQGKDQWCVFLYWQFSKILNPVRPLQKICACALLSLQLGKENIQMSDVDLPVAVQICFLFSWLLRSTDNRFFSLQLPSVHLKAFLIAWVNRLSLQTDFLDLCLFFLFWGLFLRVFNFFSIGPHRFLKNVL